METHVDEGTPLSDYLEGKGEREEQEWQEPIQNNAGNDVSPPPSPLQDFAPRGLARVRKTFRENGRKPANLVSPRDAASNLNFDDIHSRFAPLINFFQAFFESSTCSIDWKRSVGFLERLRLGIVQSQLLDNPLVLGLQPSSEVHVAQPAENASFHGLSTRGATGAIIVGFGAAALIRWLWQDGQSPTWKRLVATVAILAVMSWLSRTYIRRESLRVIQRQGLVEASEFLSLSRDFDRANSAGLNFVMEVELVARGYKLSTPIPPISRLENNGQNIKCLELRRALRTSLTDVIAKYYQTAFAIWGFAEQTAMLQLQSQYQFTVADVVDRFEQFSREVGEDTERLQALKDSAFLFHDIRKVFLSGILALHTDGKYATDHVRFETLTNSFKELNEVTRQAYERVRDILAEDEVVQIPKTPKTPQAPGQDKWRLHVRRLNSMTMNIRSVQAKLHLLREESSKVLNEADDITDLGPMFLAQYDSVGQDLRDLMEAWQSGKASLASGIDRNEKRLSSIGSVMMSPTSSMSGQTIAEEDRSPDGSESGVEDALKKLNGESNSPTNFKEPEIFEAMSLPPLPRPKSTMTREERIIKMREDRKVKELARESVDARRGMMRELQGVLMQKPANSRMSL